MKYALNLANALILLVSLKETDELEPTSEMIVISSSGYGSWQIISIWDCHLHMLAC